MTVKLIQGDCLEEMQKLANDGVKVDMVLTDPPYGTIKNLSLDGWKKQTTEWDTALPTKEMFDCCEKILRLKGTCILFSQEPYTSYLRQFKPQNLPFIYPLYWFKDHFANPFMSGKAPVNYVEDLTVFRKKYDLNSNEQLREYSKKLCDEYGRSNIIKKIGGRVDHFLRYGSSQFEICTEETYNKLIEEFHIDKLPYFKHYHELKGIRPIFNLYGSKYKSNVLEYPKSYNHYHPTEKPVDLLKDLILTYTDENDLVLDFTMGSGSTGVACLETNRNFIGIELDENYYKIAQERINETKKQTKLM